MWNTVQSPCIYRCCPILQPIILVPTLRDALGLGWKCGPWKTVISLGGMLLFRHSSFPSLQLANGVEARLFGDLAQVARSQGGAVPRPFTCRHSPTVWPGTLHTARGSTSGSGNGNAGSAPPAARCGHARSRGCCSHLVEHCLWCMAVRGCLGSPELDQAHKSQVRAHRRQGAWLGGSCGVAAERPQNCGCAAAGGWHGPFAPSSLSQHAGNRVLPTSMSGTGSSQKDHGICTSAGQARTQPVEGE